MNDEIYCALSGQVPPEEIMEFQGEDDDIPIGWTKITLTTKLPNPEWLLLQDLMTSEIDGSYSMLQQNVKMQKEQLSEEELETYEEPDIEDMKSIISLQVRAKYGSLLINLDQFFFEEGVSFISDDESAEIIASLDEVKKKFDL